MKLEDIRLFERIAARKSVSAGGKDCGLTPTVASDRLRRLETHLGCMLANRTTRAFSLTAEGRHFLEAARRILQDYDAVRHLVGPQAKELQGRLVITAPYLFGRRYLREPLHRFMGDHPKFSLEVRLSDRVLDYAKDGIDLAIRIGVLTDSTLKARRLGDNVRLLCASPGYLRKFGTPQTPEDLMGHACLIFQEETAWTFSKGDEDISVSVAGRLHSDSADIVRQAAVDGLGIALRSLWDVRDDLDKGTLVQVLPDYTMRSEMAIWAIFPPGRFVSPAARAFSDLVYGVLEPLRTATKKR